MMEAPQNLVFLHWDFKYFLQSLSQPHAPPKRRSLDELWCVFQGLGHPFFGERRSTTIYLASLPLVRGTQLEFFCLKLSVQKCLQIAVNLATVPSLILILWLFWIFFHHFLVRFLVSFCLSQWWVGVCLPLEAAGERLQEKGNNCKSKGKKGICSLSE